MVLSDVYGTGLGIVTIKGVAFGTNVIFTGLLVETLEELEEMVMIETSSTGIGETGVFSNKIFFYLSGTECLPSTKDS